MTLTSSAVSSAAMLRYGPGFMRSALCHDGVSRTPRCRIRIQILPDLDEARSRHNRPGEGLGGAWSPCDPGGAGLQEDAEGFCSERAHRRRGAWLQAVKARRILRMSHGRRLAGPNEC